MHSARMSDLGSQNTSHHHSFPLRISLASWISRHEANPGSDDDSSSDDPMIVNAKKTMPGRLRELVERPTGKCTTFKRDLLSTVSAVKAAEMMIDNAPEPYHRSVERF